MEKKIASDLLKKVTLLYSLLPLQTGALFIAVFGDIETPHRKVSGGVALNVGSLIESQHRVV